MPDWLPVVLTVTGTLLVALISAIVTYRIGAAKNRNDLEAQRQAIAAKAAADELARETLAHEIQQSIIRQLQDERNATDQKLRDQRLEYEGKIGELNTRITDFWADKHASRQYIFMLERHINDGSPPPPPAPPPGYVP